MTDHAQPPPRANGAAAEFTGRAGDENRSHCATRVRQPAAAVTADGYAAGTLDRWLRTRERALGGRLVLHRDTERAAELLAEALGGRAAAYRWAVALVAEVGR